MINMEADRAAIWSHHSEPTDATTTFTHKWGGGNTLAVDIQLIPTIGNLTEYSDTGS